MATKNYKFEYNGIQLETRFVGLIGNKVHIQVSGKCKGHEMSAAVQLDEKATDIEFYHAMAAFLLLHGLKNMQTAEENESQKLFKEHIILPFTLDQLKQVVEPPN